MPEVAFHGTAKSFTRFHVPPCGVHFGTLDQAAHAATIQLGRMDADQFALLEPNASGWRGRIIEAKLHFQFPKRVADAKTSECWEQEIRAAQDEGYDCLVYQNDFEGRKPEDSFIVWRTELIEVVNPNHNSN